MYGKYTSSMDRIGRYFFKQTNRAPAGGVFCLGWICSLERHLNNQAGVVFWGEFFDDFLIGGY